MTSHFTEDTSLSLTVTPIVVDDSKNFKQFRVLKSGLSNFKVCPLSSDKAHFFVQSSLYTPGKFDVTLHAGNDAHGKMLGFVDLKKFAGHYEVGLGDPKLELASVVMEPLDVVPHFASRHRFEYELRKDGRKAFMWKHPGERLSEHPGEMELVQEDDEDLVLAQYVQAETHSWKNKGNLLIREGYGDEWQTMVMLTGMALVVVRGRT